MKHTVDAMGKQCPIPVVMTKKILDKAEQGDEILILVDRQSLRSSAHRLFRREIIPLPSLPIRWEMEIRSLAGS